MNKATISAVMRAMGSKGGKAAAESMTARQRKARSKKAAAASVKARRRNNREYAQ
jgi:hypothetical protein